ncbi:hypothetical protein DES52_10264 [Deinococcus yavapaiensis KR-236]|uniref:Uncharacterized protein n=1 Tax=Deinococcus yavapaiensis KR-236 TaxID=694435 RepID=A0A318S916_9DEIO|nr:hypothetical protein DES52_10264 [Deinococcus yavapaiensis KR-236]
MSMRPEELLEATKEHLRHLHAEADLERRLSPLERPKTILKWRRFFIPVLLPTVERLAP